MQATHPIGFNEVVRLRVECNIADLLDDASVAASLEAPSERKTQTMGVALGKVAADGHAQHSPSKARGKGVVNDSPGTRTTRLTHTHVTHHTKASENAAPTGNSPKGTRRVDVRKKARPVLRLCRRCTQRCERFEAALHTCFDVARWPVICALKQVPPIPSLSFSLFLATPLHPASLSTLLSAVFSDSISASWSSQDAHQIYLSSF